MTYKIKEITEEDYGCEGVPDGGELMCSVLVDGADGKKWLRIADRLLRENSLDVGSEGDEAALRELMS